MEQPHIFSRGEGKYQIVLIVQETGGNGICCFLGGGEKVHVGGTALACLGRKLEGEGETCDIWRLTLPGHKDALLAERLARRLCIAAEQPVSITVGIHLDGATGEDIRRLSDESVEAVEAYLRQIGKA